MQGIFLHQSHPSTFHIPLAQYPHSGKWPTANRERETSSNVPPTLRPPCRSTILILLSYHKTPVTHQLPQTNDKLHQQPQAESFNAPLVQTCRPLYSFTTMALRSQLSTRPRLGLRGLSIQLPSRLLSRSSRHYARTGQVHTPCFIRLMAADNPAPTRCSQSSEKMRGTQYSDHRHGFLTEATIGTATTPTPPNQLGRAKSQK